MKCEDCSANIVNGKCLCDEGYKMDEKSLCVLKEESEECVEPFVLVDGECVCP